MDINDLRSAFTLVSFLIFLGIVGWAWSKRNKANFDEAAKLPFNED
ncbi:MAG: cbb3-type cytochrome c oxidase subunit 3 [Hydrogenophaga sp.]|nr:cbb3-type cytochrome c oxidase subunit 3 [Hydrogenophaga sp.]MDP2416205.1 cbb3-type cytochrome c oxidase subunit 3 [Hydrogenophaga sp.]MDZ4188219.1 cbb3-type cytochrome c oxidase subunit 3 [Hydrogenophaga sp.]